MPLIKVNGTRLYVTIEGEGTPLVMLHGLGGNHLYWQHEMNQLKDHYQVIALDSRGHGKSDKPSSYTLQDHIEDVITLIDTLDLSSCYLMGISAGSYIAQGVSVVAPDRVKKMILVAPKSNGLISSTQAFFDKHSQEVENLSEEEKQNFLYRHIYYNFDAFLKVAAAMFREPLTPEQIEVANRALNGFDFRQDLHKVTAKTLVISGKHDILNPPEAGQECASLIPDASFVTMEESGHGPNFEEPELYMKIVQEFLKE